MSEFTATVYLGRMDSTDWINLAFEQAHNRLMYGVDSPNGGRGPFLYPLSMAI